MPVSTTMGHKTNNLVITQLGVTVRFFVKKESAAMYGCDILNITGMNWLDIQ
jgi:hypothetical protein